MCVCVRADEGEKMVECVCVTICECVGKCVRLRLRMRVCMCMCVFVVAFQIFSRCAWVFLQRTRILSGIQFTTHFIDFLIVETKRFVGSFVNVILTRQSYGQRSSRAAESKRRARGNHFSE